MMRTAVKTATRDAHGRRAISAMAFRAAKKMMPKISDTERVAMFAGSIGFDRDIFSGSPSLQALVDTYPAPRYTEAEQHFLDNECEALCGLVEDHVVQANKVSFLLMYPFFSY